MGAPILRGRDILAIVELIYFVPMLFVAIMCCRRHGFSKQLGWLSMVVLACFRISASSTWIAASYDSKINSLVTASIILQSFGMATIVVSLQGLLRRLNGLMPEHGRLPSRVFQVAHLLTSVAVALAIAGAVGLGDSKTGNDPTARTLQRSAMIVFLVIFAFLCATNINILLHRQIFDVSDSDRPILTATTISLPLILCRLLFGVLAVYQVDAGVFSMLSQNTGAVIATAFMSTLPEFIIAAVILRAGFKVPTLKQTDTVTSKQQSLGPTVATRPGVESESRMQSMAVSRIGMGTFGKYSV